MGKRLSMALLLLMWSLAAGAATVENLLQVRLPVKDQSESAQQDAFKEGLRTVAVRLTGRESVRDSSAVERLAEDAAQYVQRFQYRSRDDGLVLETSFYGEALRRALVEQGVPVWEANRPAVLVWMAVERQGGRTLVGRSQAPQLRQAMEKAALSFGIPLAFPELSGSDGASVSSSDIWGGFTDAIVEASQSYDTSLIWVGRIEQQGGGWRGRWRLRGDRGWASWTGQGGDLEALFEGAASELASRLVDRYAGLPDLASGPVLRIHVRDVDSAERYAELEQFLKAMSGVESVELESAQDDEISYRLILNVDAQRITSALERSRLLLPVVSAGRVEEAGDGDGEGEGEGQRALGEGEHLYRLTP